MKDPEKQAFVSWHKDAKYQGFKPYNFVTAWLAVTDSNEENGCMIMWTGSHNELREHRDTFNDDNLLTRGQTVQNVPENETSPIVLKAGQMSLHHPLVVHGSSENKSQSRRIGFVIQSYIGSDVDQVMGKVYVQQARGVDQFKYHAHSRRPTEVMNEKDAAFRQDANKELQQILYKGSQKVRNL
jgi:ectoine hydroxylase-related dioxygenase (phytanoyl-CoA dioxygenase family)